MSQTTAIKHFRECGNSKKSVRKYARRLIQDLNKLMAKYEDAKNDGLLEEPIPFFETEK